MKATKYILLLWAAAVCLTACKNDNEIVKDDEPEEDIFELTWNVGGSNTGSTSPTEVIKESWSSGDVIEFSTDENGKTQDITIYFATTCNWTASVTSGAIWCMISQTKGKAGTHSIIISAIGETLIERIATIVIRTEEGSSIRLQVKQKVRQQGKEEKSEDVLVNEIVDEYLSSYYLWNDEWRGLTKQTNQGYEDYFYGYLQSMTTNTLDYKTYTLSDGSTYKSLFSYIEKKNKISETRSTQIEKELEYCTGFTGLQPIQIVDSLYNPRFVVFCIEGVYPDSPAAESGLKRGDYIYKINGEEIDASNYVDLYYDLVYPESVGSFTIEQWLMGDDDRFIYDDPVKKTPKTTEHRITTRAMYKNPVLHHEVIDAEGGRKIGYLVYDNFDAGFDEELFSVFKEFKTAGIQDMVLDLRYNGGGHVVSANMIASCVAGSYCHGKVFAKYRYNDERMAKMSDADTEEGFLYSGYANLTSTGRTTSLANGDLGLSRLYCLVGGGTASASELVINGLRGIDIDVILIGGQTYGKNVGMEVEERVVNNNTYDIVPITFQSYNAKGESDFERGFTPNIELDETEYGDNHLLYLDYGNRRELLLARALAEITGAGSTAATRHYVHRPVLGKQMKRPSKPRHGHEGMIKPLQR